MRSAAGRHRFIGWMDYTGRPHSMQVQHDVSNTIARWHQVTLDARPRPHAGVPRLLIPPMAALGYKAIGHSDTKQASVFDEPTQGWPVKVHANAMPHRPVVRGTEARRCEARRQAWAVAHPRQFIRRQVQALKSLASSVDVPMHTSTGRLYKQMSARNRPQDFTHAFDLNGPARHRTAGALRT